MEAQEAGTPRFAHTAAASRAAAAAFNFEF